MNKFKPKRIMVTWIKKGYRNEKDDEAMISNNQIKKKTYMN